MARIAPPFVRSVLLIANAGVWIGCGWFVCLAWNAWVHSPLLPLLATAQDRVSEIAGNCLSFAFPYITGWAYSTGAVLTLAKLRPVLLTTPPRWLHGLIVLLCVASTISVSWQLRGASAWAHVSWFTAAIPAVLSAVVPSWRRHTYQIIGLTSGGHLLTIIPYSSWFGIGFAAVWICTATCFLLGSGRAHVAR